MSLSVAFRVDATARIGSGHFMRCLTLAIALRKRGASVRFVSRNLPPHLIDKLNQADVQLAMLQNDTVPDSAGYLAHSSWLDSSQAEDARATITALHDRKWDWLVVDHYALDAQWESALRDVTSRIMVIDDLADRRHNCDLLLDQNYYSDMSSRYAQQVSEHCRMLIGPQYALLRPEFAELRKQIKPRVGAVRRVLVFFGGVDVGNFTDKAIQALSGLAHTDLAVDVVIGVQHPNRDEIEQACAAHGYVCHVNTSEMAQLMAQADLAISAGGSAAWERCCLGLPAFSLCTAENQRRQVADAAAIGLLYAPLVTSDVVDSIRRHAAALIENPALLQWLSYNAMNAVDGQGVSRCIAEMSIPGADPEGGQVTVRSAVDQDATNVWSWRNHEITRRYSFDPSPVSLASHLAWWRDSLNNTQRCLLIGEQGAQALGVLRFDFRANDKALVSIYLDPAMTGRGMGPTLILSGLDWLKKNRPEVSIVNAEILTANAASLKAFQTAGFSEQYKVLTRKI